MSTSQRVSRGFHRLGIFLAIIILLIGVPYLLFQGLGSTGYYWRQNEALVCAHDLLQRDPKRFWDLNHFQPEEVNQVTDNQYIDLKALGCSDPYEAPGPIKELVSFGEVRVVPTFSWISTFGSQLLDSLVLS